MRRFAFVVGLAVMTTGLGGCAAALVGGLLYDNASDNSDRQKWTQAFGQQNLEREKAGLQPLDWCSEIYKAKRGWAMNNDACAARVRRFEAGDTSALTI